MTNTPKPEPSELAKRIAVLWIHTQMADDCPHVEIATDHKFKSQCPTCLAEFISTSGLAELEAENKQHKEAHQSCRDGWTKADDYCHELEQRLAVAERTLASKWMSEDCCQVCGCPLTYTGESGAGVEQYDCQVCQADGEIGDWQRKVVAVERERDEAREVNRKYGLALIMIAGDCLDTPEHAKASREIAQGALQLATTEGGNGDGSN